ncbi:MAG: heme peroxidase [Actinobacteria bacterium]|nr:MAG: heme peroxidase [Actinomycetota bacterium]
MLRHGFESYYVIGEGLLGESGRGRQLLSATAAPPFRFSRMGPSGVGRQLGDPNLRKIAAAITAGASSPASGVPAGFTYLGQFIDHDLTFDKTNVMLGQNVTPAQLLQARSPSLDLDSLYGAGPQDPASAKFYESDGLHLKMGDAIAAGGEPAFPKHDLPRVGVGSSNAAKRTALIPDPRNDENLAVAQTHLAFIRFHNRVVDTLPSSTPAAQKFAAARELVTKHYQWMIRTDFLPRICKQSVVTDVFGHGRKAFEVGAVPTDVPTMPIEFSVAAYRLGHSMIRAAYNWNKDFDAGGGTLDYLFEFSGLSGDLGGNLKLASNWVADFRRLYDFAEAGKANLTVPAAKFNRARRIDTKIANPLHDLPSGTVGDPAIPDEDPRRNLAFRNLVRGKMVKLATGQQMVRFLKNKGITLNGLSRPQIRDGNGGADLGTLTTNQRNALLTNTPLWFYVLREAELNNGAMRGVGGRIVAETFHRAMEGSEFSIVRDTAFRPSLGPNNTTFRMVDLLMFAFEGNGALLNPLGD